MRRRWFLALLAVVAGNVVYRLAMPYLPAFAQHQLLKIDFGLVVYSLISLVFYGLLLWFDRR